MAREHEAGKSSLIEILKFANRECDSIISRIDALRSKSLLKRDKDVC